MSNPITSIEFVFETEKNRSLQETSSEICFFKKLFEALNEIIPIGVIDSSQTVTDFKNPHKEKALDASSKIIYTDVLEQGGYHFTLTTTLSIDELAHTFAKHGVIALSTENCPSDIRPCMVHLARVN